MRLKLVVEARGLVLKSEWRRRNFIIRCLSTPRFSPRQTVLVILGSRDSKYSQVQEASKTHIPGKFYRQYPYLPLTPVTFAVWLSKCDGV
jgi:hypothetical protein